MKNVKWLAAFFQKMNLFFKQLLLFFFKVSNFIAYFNSFMFFRLSWKNVIFIFYMILFVFFFLILFFLFYFVFCFFVFYWEMLVFGYNEQAFMLHLLYFWEIYFENMSPELLPDFFDFDFQYSLFCLIYQTFIYDINNLYFAKLITLWVKILSFFSKF